ncbi:MAG: hypothetical protein NUV67_03135 [archaeon]|nr:hypothetical protein [archaeon]
MAKKKSTKKVVKKKTTAKKTVKRQKAAGASAKVSSIVSSVDMEGNHSLLREALGDIAKELNQLRVEKQELESTLDNVAGDISSTQNKEVQLKEQLSKLGSVENALTLKRTRVRKKLESVKTKIQKVRDLSTKMENI